MSYRVLSGTVAYVIRNVEIEHLFAVRVPLTLNSNGWVAVSWTVEIIDVDLRIAFNL